MKGIEELVAIGAQERTKEFSKKYGYGKVIGLIEGGDGTPVTLSMVSLTTHSSKERNREYGAKPDEIAILVDFIPAGMEYENRKEKGVNPAKIPPQETWVAFPKTFYSLPIYYKRGAMAFAQG